jgi:tetratricopeptide (TPR) repeat protein
MLYKVAELDAAALRHASFYQSKLKTLQSTYEEAPQSAIQKLRQTLPQIQQAHTWLYDRALADPSHAELLTDMTAAGMGYVRMVVSPDEWQRWLDQGLEAAVIANREREQLDFRFEQGVQAFRQGDLARAGNIAAEALPLAHQHNEPTCVARLYYLSALVHQKQGELDAAKHAVQQAQYHYETAGDIYGIGKVRSFMAQAAIDAANYDQAQTLLQQNIALWQQHDNPRQMAVEQYQLGVMLSNRLRFDEADGYLYEARQTFQQLADRRYEAYTLQILCHNQIEREAHDEALAMIEQAHDLFEQVNDRRGMAGCLNYMGRIYAAQYQPEHALQRHQQAVDVARSINYHFAQADAYREMCELYLKESDVAAAQQHLCAAVHAASASGSKLLVLAVLCAAVGVLRADERPSVAAQVAQTVQVATEEPIILDMLAPHIAGMSSKTDVSITADEAVELLKNLYS